MARKNTRARNNDGSIIFDEEKQTYRVFLTAPDGSRPSKRFKNVDDAVAWKNEKLNEMRKGQYVASSEITLGQFLEIWMEEEIMPPNCSEKTYEDYNSKIRTHLPPISAIPIQELLPYHINQILTTMRKNGRKEKTIRDLYGMLHQALEAAKRNYKIINKNIMDDIDRPKLPKIKKDVKTTDAAGIKKLINAAEGSRIYAGVYLIGNTAVRLGEALGLQWEDIVWDICLIKIQRQLVRRKKPGQKKSEIKFDDLKTENSDREIYVGQDVLDVLQDERQRQLKDPDMKNSKTVICNRLGRPMEPRKFREEFKKIADKAGIDVHRHGLRHSVASALIANGVSAADVSALLGHADEAFTYRQYVHSQKDATKKAAATMSEALNPKPKLSFSKKITIKKKQTK